MFKLTIKGKDHGRQFTRKETALKAAQIVAQLRGGVTVRVWEVARRLPVGLAQGPELPSPYVEYMAKNHLYLTRARLAENFRELEIRAKEAGRNAGRVFSACRELFPGHKLVITRGYCGRSVLDKTRNEYICRLDDFMRPGGSLVFIERNYRFASTNPGKPVLSGARGVTAIIDGQRYYVSTWLDAHEVSAYPVPEAEKRCA